MLLLQSCGDSELYKQLSDIDGFIRQRPDSALALLRRIDTTRISSARDRAYYGVMYQMALDKNKIDTTDTRIIAPAVAYYDKHGTPDQRMLAYFYLGRVLYNAHRWTESVEAYMESIYEEDKVHDRRTLALAYNDIAEVAAKEYLNTEEQLSYLEKSYDLFMEVKDTVSAIGELVNIATIYYRYEDYERSIEMFKSTLANPKLKRIAYYKGASRYAYFLCQETSFNPKKAVEVFEDVLSRFGRLPDESYWAAYAYALDVIGETDSASYIFAQLSSSKVNPIVEGWKDLYYLRRKDYENAYKSFKITINYEDSILNEKLKQNATITQRDFYAKKNTANIIKGKELQLRFSFILWVLLIVSFAAFFIMQARIRKSRKERLLLINTAEELKQIQELSDKKYTSDLAGLKKDYVSLFKNNLKEISVICENYLLSKEHGGGSVSVNLKQQLDRLGFDNEKYPLFERKVDKVLDGIMSSFRKDCPNFKETDYRIFCYTVSGFDPHFIALLMGIENPGVLYSRKLRIKKRIEESSVLGKEKYLESFVNPRNY